MWRGRARNLLKIEVEQIQQEVGSTAVNTDNLSIWQFLRRECNTYLNFALCYKHRYHLSKRFVAFAYSVSCTNYATNHER